MSHMSTTDQPAPFRGDDGRRHDEEPGNGVAVEQDPMIPTPAAGSPPRRRAGLTTDLGSDADQEVGSTELTTNTQLAIGQSPNKDGLTRISSTATATPPAHESDDKGLDALAQSNDILRRAKKILVTFGKFVGPGFLIAVAYSESLRCRKSRCSRGLRIDD